MYIHYTTLFTFEFICSNVYIRIVVYKLIRQTGNSYVNNNSRPGGSYEVDFILWGVLVRHWLSFLNQVRASI